MLTRDQAAETVHALRGLPLPVAPLCGVTHPPTLREEKHGVHSFSQIGTEAQMRRRGGAGVRPGGMELGSRRVSLHPNLPLLASLFHLCESVRICGRNPLFSSAARIVGHLTSRDWQEIQARLSLALAVRPRRPAAGHNASGVVAPHPQRAAGIA